MWFHGVIQVHPSLVLLHKQGMILGSIYSIGKHGQPCQFAKLQIAILLEQNA